MDTYRQAFSATNKFTFLLGVTSNGHYKFVYETFQNQNNKGTYKPLFNHTIKYKRKRINVIVLGFFFVKNILLLIFRNNYKRLYDYLNDNLSTVMVSDEIIKIS